MAIELRTYQREAVDAILGYWADGGGNPLVDLATGAGKSICIATLVRELIECYPEFRILCLVHVRELVEQNAKAMLKLWPQAPIGINSAGLGRRDWHSPIMFASIQSVYKRPRMLGKRDLVIVDEAHLIPNSGDGMYLTLLENLRDETPDLRVAGFTATPYRLGMGRLDQGDGRIFDKTVYAYGIGHGVADGFLSPLTSKNTATKLDVSGVERRGGEFIESALQLAVDVDSITQAAVDETIEFGRDRRSWLVFCSGVLHAGHVAQALTSRGIIAAVVTGETPAQDRDRTFRDFKSGKIRALCGANVFTTGFDAPNVDMIAMLRPTTSKGLYVQICGRGTRLAEGKTNCLVLDFAGNVRRLGPVDEIDVQCDLKKPGEKDDAVKPDSVRAKECPECQELVGLAALSCPVCGHEWPKPAPKIEPKADTAPIMSGRKPDDPWMKVTSVEYHVHHKRMSDSPPTLRVDYCVGYKSYSEWVCFQHQGFARQKAVSWWNKMKGDSPVPATVDDACERASDGEIVRPTRIVVRKEPSKDGKEFDRVVGHRFD